MATKSELKRAEREQAELKKKPVRNKLIPQPKEKHVED